MSIEGYVEYRVNNIEGLNSGEDIQAQIDAINLTLTDVTFNGVDTTEIENNLLIPVGYNFQLGTITDVEQKILDIEAQEGDLIGISYNAGTDTTTIDNNLIIPAPKQFDLGAITDVEDYITYTYDTAVIVDGRTQEMTFTEGFTNFIGEVRLLDTLRIGSSNYTEIYKSSNDLVLKTSHSEGSHLLQFNDNTFYKFSKTELDCNNKNITDVNSITSVAESTEVLTVRDITHNPYGWKGFIYQDGTNLVIDNTDPISDNSYGAEVWIQGYIFSADGLFLNNKDITTCNIVNCTDVSFTDNPSLLATIEGIQNQLTDISYSTDTTTINNNVVISSGKTLTVDGSTFTPSNYAKLNTSNAFTGNTNTFNSYLPTSTITATTDYQFTNLSTVNSLIAARPIPTDYYTPDSTRYIYDDFNDGLNEPTIGWRWSIGGDNPNINIRPNTINHYGVFRLTIAGNEHKYLIPTALEDVGFHYSSINEFNWIFHPIFGDTSIEVVGGWVSGTTGKNIYIKISYDTVSSVKTTGYINDTNILGSSFFNITIVSSNWYRIRIKRESSTNTSFLIQDLSANTSSGNNVYSHSSVDLSEKYYPYMSMKSTNSTGNKSLDIDFVSVQYTCDRS